MATAKLTVLNHDHSVSQIDTDNPLSVAIVANDRHLLHACGSIAGLGDNLIIAAPGAGYRIVVVAWVVQNETATGTLIQLKDGGGPIWRYYAATNLFPLPLPLGGGSFWKLTENTALNISLSVATTVGYSIAYYIERVP